MWNFAASSYLRDTFVPMLVLSFLLAIVLFH
jgi:hypothetical protein